MTPFRLTLAGVALLAGSPAAVRVTGGAEVHGTAGPVCRPLERSKHLPGVNVLLDSVALVDRLRSADPRAGDEVIVSVLYSNPPSGHPVEGPPPITNPDDVVTAVMSSLRPAPKEAPSAFRAHLRLGPTPAIALEPSVLCGPTGPEGTTTIRVPFEVGRVEDAQSARIMPERPRSISARYRVGKEGEVMEVTIAAGSGVPQADREIAAAMQAQRFRPALLDGRPVEVWVSGSRVELIP